MFDRGRVPESGVGAAQLGRHARVAHGEAAHVHLVQDGLGPGRLRPLVVVPVVVVVHDHGLGHVRRGVPVVPDGVGDVPLGPVADGAAGGVVRGVAAVDGAGVRVEQQLRRVPAGARPRVPPAVHPEAVAGAGQDAGQVAVPGLEVLLGEAVPGLPAVLVEQAQVDGLRAGRPEREVGAPGALGAGAEAGAERLPAAGPGGVGPGCAGPGRVGRRLGGSAGVRRGSAPVGRFARSRARSQFLPCRHGRTPPSTRCPVPRPTLVP